MHMDYPTSTNGSYTIVSLAGEVDLHCSPDARKQILGLLGDNNNVLIDMSAVEYIDSSGIASLVEALRLAKANNVEFGLVSVSAPAMKVLQLARLDKVFKINDSVSDFTGEAA